MREIRLCAEAEVDPGKSLQVEVDGREPLAVFSVEGKIYVTDDYCTHGKASLSDEGDLDGFTIICAWHDGAFDIRTGEVKARPCTEPLKVYTVSLREGDVYITLD